MMTTERQIGHQHGISKCQAKRTATMKEHDQRDMAPSLKAQRSREAVNSPCAWAPVSARRLSTPREVGARVGQEECPSFGFQLCVPLPGATNDERELRRCLRQQAWRACLPWHGSIDLRTRTKPNHMPSSSTAAETVGEAPRSRVADFTIFKMSNLMHRFELPASRFNPRKIVSRRTGKVYSTIVCMGIDMPSLEYIG